MVDMNTLATIDSDNAVLASFPGSARIVDVRLQQVLEYSDICKKVAAGVAEISTLGLPPGMPVVIGQKSALDTLLSLFATWQAGHPAVVVNPKLRALEQANVLAFTQAVAWLGPFHGNLPRKGSQTATKRKSSAPGHNDAALVLMTSGTTGIPKGIVHTIHSLEARLALNVAHIGSHVLARSLCVLPAYFGHGLIGNCLTPLAAGATLVLWDSPEVSHIANLGDIIDEHDISFMSSVPSFWNLAMRLGQPPKSPLRRLHIGSAPLSYEQWEQIAEWNGTKDVYNMFGTTETANWIAGGALRDADGRDGYVGNCWGGRLAVLDDKGVVRTHGRGEVLIQSSSMMVEYLNAPDKTDEAFHGTWFRSGDIGKLSVTGQLQLVGRIKSEINRGGIKILAEEIDMLLERHRDIVEACTFGMDDPVSGEIIAAAIVLADHIESNTAGIKKWCRDTVRPEAVPAKLFVVSEIPKNDRGKVVRAQVKQMFAGR